MPDYTSYVTAVYGIAALVYGGLTLIWNMRLKRLQKRLQMEKMLHGERKTGEVG